MEPGIKARILNDKNLLLLHGVGTKCLFSGCFADAEANLGLEPLAGLIDQRNISDWSLETFKGKVDKIIKRYFWQRIECGKILQSLKACDFISHND